MRRDAYVTLAGWEDGGRLVAVEVLVNPLVAWMWIGGIVMTAGGVLCLLPRLVPLRVSEPVVQVATGFGVARGSVVP
jgi:cytochrome c biogenesis factor